MFGEKDGWLTGWKTIARYIGRHPNTAKKYHLKYGMPVRRDPGNTAVALKHELDGWLVRFNELVKRYGTDSVGLEHRFKAKKK